VSLRVAGAERVAASQAVLDESWLRDDEEDSESLWGGVHVSLLGSADADAVLRSDVERGEKPFRVRAVHCCGVRHAVCAWWGALCGAFGLVWPGFCERTPAAEASAVLWDAAAVENALFALTAIVRHGLVEDTADMLRPLVPVIVSSVTHLHWAVRRFALSPAFRGDSLPIANDEARALLVLRRDALRLVQVSQWAAVDLVDAISPADVDALPLLPPIRAVLVRLTRGGPGGRPLGLPRAIVPLAPTAHGIFGNPFASLLVSVSPALSLPKDTEATTLSSASSSSTRRSPTPAPRSHLR
jgi:hypothetical protein